MLAAPVRRRDTDREQFNGRDVSNQNAIAINPAAAPALAGAARQVARADSAPPVQTAIADAARRTSVDFDFLLAQAEVESSLDPTAKARTSSATGLYQFIESTWLNTMKRHGDRFGLGEVAARIRTSAGGQAYVSNPAQRQAILALRNDPHVSSLMAAGLAEDNRAHLMPILGRQPDHGELYLAHFLGAGGAGRFLSELAQDPNQNAPALFRQPAAANRAIFFERNGSPRTLAEVMNVIDGKMDRALARADAAGFTAAGQRPSERAPYALAAVTPPPYIIADEAVFEPGNPPAITGANRPTIAPLPLLAQGGAVSVAAPTARPVSMSNLLKATFGASEGQALQSAEGSAQVRRAYDRLKALGL